MEVRNLSPEKITDLKEQAKQQFPYDMALQEIHVARKVLALEANIMGLSYLAYIKQLVKQIKPQNISQIGQFVEGELLE